MDKPHINGVFAVTGFVVVMVRAEGQRGVQNVLTALPICHESGSLIESSTLYAYPCIGPAWATWRNGVVTDLVYGPTKPALRPLPTAVEHSRATV